MHFKYSPHGQTLMRSFRPRPVASPYGQTIPRMHPFCSSRSLWNNVVMTDSKDVKLATTSFMQDLLNNYDQQHGIISFIGSGLDEETACYISDYFLDVVQTIEVSITGMDIILNEYKTARDNEQRYTRQRFKAEGNKPGSLPHSKEEERYRTFRETFKNEFFLKFGGVMDLLSACVIISTGVKLDIRRSSFGDISPTGSLMDRISSAKNPLCLSEDNVTRTSQISLLKVIFPLIDGETRPWFDWVMEYRNRTVHRAQGVEFTLIRSRGLEGNYEIFHLPTKHPREGVASTFARQGGIRVASLPEDIYTIMKSTLVELCRITVAVIMACSHFCQNRAKGELNIFQHPGQWIQKDKAERSSFNGCNPNDSIQRSLNKSDTILLHPFLSKRLEGASKLITRKAY